jgi:hypothetical protein
MTYLTAISLLLADCRATHVELCVAPHVDDGVVIVHIAIGDRAAGFHAVFILKEPMQTTANFIPFD